MWSGIYESPTLPFYKFLLLQSTGWGTWAFVPLRYASDSGAARICVREGAEGRERSDRAGEGVRGGFPPSMHSREIFENWCMKTVFSCTLNAIIRGSLCTGIDWFLTPPFFYTPINGGGGG